ncbi:alpha/beta hydrolase [Siccirubricoccus deserti]|uniref:alpha/beta fold hydrolase n=1 Tax=Siccirubricoccus deserti TaxID=2013562 RepID=UPI0019AA46B8|nr:alpha/beta fold hydrolase [Siccirubricoccus deserti]GGC41632.1 alpha/beta hydrolase [Siccirubricoccus deserti]
MPRSKAGRQEAARITAALAAGGHAPEAFHAAVLRVLRRQDAALLNGVAGYRRHPQRREMAEPPVVWAEGGSRLLDYGGGDDGPAVLVVPSLVNRADVLDLLPEASCLRYLAAQGARVLLLDWGTPGEAERGFSLTDYVAGRLERALLAAADLTGGRLVLVGYCMGGLLALAVAQRRPKQLAALALWATPWDFWAEEEAAPRALATLLPALEPLLEATGTLPVDAIQTLFAGLDPFAIGEKYRAFARLDPTSPRARRFVALEDWLNDGVPLAAPVARECLAGWYGANTPMRGAWRIAGEAVTPARLALPAFLAIPSRDRIVPPAAALALAPLLPRAQVHRAAAGHVGMVAGSTADAALWTPFLAWRASLPI